MAQLITVGIDYAKFMADVQAIINKSLVSATSPTDPIVEVGGIELAQEITRLSKPRIYALVAARGIPHSKRGNKLYFYRAELMAWVQEGKRYGKEVASA
jgi:excisionase family DNA binding protein